jgi:hypothetical protein
MTLDLFLEGGLRLVTRLTLLLFRSEENDYTNVSAFFFDATSSH